MKRSLLTFLSALIIFYFPDSIKAQCSLDQVGAPNFSTTCALSDMAAAPNGTIYVAAFNSTSNKLFLYNANTSGSWTPLASLSTSLSVKPAVAVNKVNGKVYVFIRNESAGKLGELYYLSGSSLVMLGSPLSGSDIVSDLSIAFNSLGEEYVAYTDVTLSNKSVVKKWNGSSWVTVGGGPVSAGTAFFNSLIIDAGDNPVLAYQDGTFSNQTRVMKFNGSTWSPIGLLGSSTTNCKLKSANNSSNYYLGYTETTGSGVVQVYNGSTWSALGSPVTNLSSTANSFDLDIDPTDNPTFTAILGTPPYPVAYKYTGVPTWSASVTGYLASSTSLNTNVAFDAAGSPYFFYVDQTNNNGLNVKTISVSTNILSQPTSSTVVCSGFAGSIGVGYGGAVPNFQWQVLSSGSYTNVSGAISNSFGYTATPGSSLYRCVLSTGCKNIVSNTATVTGLALTVSTTFTNPTCFNTGDGAISASVTGGTGAYTYSWSPVGGTGATASGLYWNTYTLSVTDGPGYCTVTKTVTLTSPPAVSNSFSGNQTICNGSNTTLTVTTTGGVGGYTYVWTPGASLSSTTSSVVIANPTSTQTYTVTATDAGGCTATNTVIVNVNNLPSVSATASSVSICNGTTTTLSATGTGNTYVWNPGSLSGASQNVTPSSSTVYTVTATNTVSGCSNTAALSITVNPIPTVNAGPTKSLTCASSFTTTSASTVGGASYNWTGPGIVSGYTTANCNVNAPGTYNVFVTSAQGCVSSTATLSIVSNTSPPSVSATNSGSLTCVSSTVALNGTPATGVTYLWSGPGISGPTSAQNTGANSAGTYTLKVTSTVNSCTNIATTTVSQNTVAPIASASSSSVLTCALLNTSVLGGPASGVTYTWTGPGIVSGANAQNATVNTPGIYSLTVTDGTNGCTNTTSVSVTQNTVAPSVSSSVSGTLTCINGAVNSILTTTTSPATYTWSGTGISSGNGTATITVISGGVKNYTVTGIANGCKTTGTVSVAQNTVVPDATGFTSGPITCSSPTVNASVTSTTSPVTYTWTGPGIISGSGTQAISVSLPGNYNYTVTNAINGCTKSGFQTVTQNTTAPVTSVSNTGPVTCVTNTINLNSSLTGMNYTWTAPSGSSVSSGANAQNAVGLGAGTYSITVINPVNGCSYSATTSVAQNTTAPTGVNAGMDQMITCSIPNVSLNGGTVAGVTYFWSGPGISGSANTQNTTANLPGTYTLTITDPGNGCTNSDEVIVSQNTTPPTVSAGSDATLTCSTSTVTLNGNVTPGTSVVNWQGGVCGTATSVITDACTAGTYTLTATDPSNGCSASSTVNVLIDAAIPTVTLSTASATLTCFTPTISIMASTTATPVSYAWTPTTGINPGTETTSNPVFINAGSYNLALTNTLNGCSNNVNVTIVADMAAPVISASASPSVICEGNSTTLTVSGGVINNYVWTPGNLNGSSQNVSPVSTTAYSVVATNTINGCATSETITVTVNPLPILTVTGNTIICKGATANLTAIGATSYTWDSGANTNFISVTPSVTTSYTVAGGNGAGSCTATLSTIVSVISSKDITGIITSTAGATTSDVTLYKYTSSLSHWNVVATTTVTSSYSFTGMDSALYVVRAAPTATNIQVTYGPNAISWQDATVINHGCTNNSTMNIDLVALENFILGPGVLTGTVTEGLGYVPRMGGDGFRPLSPGTPIGGIVVKGGKNPGGQMFAQSVTATDGTYTLTGLPFNSSNESYFVFVDIPGLDTNLTYHREINAGNTEYDHLDFCVDSTHINPCGPGAPTAYYENSLSENNIILFPNPAKQQVSIEYELINSASVEIDLYDIVGQKVKNIVPNSYHEKDKYHCSVNLDYLSPGVYFVRLKINTSERTIRLIVNQ